MGEQQWPTRPYACQFCGERFDFPGIEPEDLADRIVFHLCAQRALALDSNANPAVRH